MTPQALIQANYPATRVAEGLLITGVELSRETTRKQRPDFLRDLTVDVFKTFIKRYNNRIAAGKVGAFVLLNHAGPCVGRILNLRIEDKQLVGDLLITNEEVIASLDRGELTERSIEWAWSATDAKLHGVALLSGKFGQDSECWPDLTIDAGQSAFYKELADFSGFQVKTLRSGLTFHGVKSDDFVQEIDAKENSMPLSPEDMKLLADNVAQMLRPMFEQLSQKSDASEGDPVNTDKVNEALARVEKREREITIGGYVETLVRKGYSNRSHLRKSLEKFGDNLQAMEVEFKRLLEKADEDVKLEMERTYEAPSLDAELAEQYRSFKEAYPQLKITEAEFRMVCKGELRNPNMKYETAIEVK